MFENSYEILRNSVSEYIIRVLVLYWNKVMYLLSFMQPLYISRMYAVDRASGSSLSITPGIRIDQKY